MNKPIRIAIVDDHKFLREALQMLLQDLEEFELIAEGDNGFDAVELVRSHELDVIILEPLVPKKDGIDVTKEIAGLDRGVNVLILTMDKTAHNAFRMLRAGALGWLPKTCDSEALIEAIRTVGRGKTYLPDFLRQEFAERYVHPDRINQPEEKLTDREFQVLRLLALGNTNKEIAKMLFVGVKTVDTHRANLLKKLALRNNADLTRFAIQNGFIRV